MTGVTLHGVVSPEHRSAQPGRDAIEAIAEALGTQTEQVVRHVRPVPTSGGRDYGQVTRKRGTTGPPSVYLS